MYRILLAILLPLILMGQTADDLARAMDERLSPQDMRSDLTMKLTNKQNKSRESTIRSISADDNTRQIIWFLSPPDDKGVAFLKIEHDDGEDEMRLWLPAFQKVRRISSKKKADSFMGSDLSYEDMTSRALDDYSYSLNGEKEIDGVLCHVLVSVPNESVTRTYGKFVTYLTKDEDLLSIYEESFDRAGKLLKTRTTKYQKIGDYNLPVEMFVKDVQAAHSTTLSFENIVVDQGVEADLFQEKNLKRLPR